MCYTFILYVYICKSSFLQPYSGGILEFERPLIGYEEDPHSFFLNQDPSFFLFPPDSPIKWYNLTKIIENLRGIYLNN